MVIRTARGPGERTGNKSGRPDTSCAPQVVFRIICLVLYVHTHATDKGSIKDAGGDRLYFKTLRRHTTAFVADDDGIPDRLATGKNIYNNILKRSDGGDFLATSLNADREKSALISIYTYFIRRKTK